VFECKNDLSTRLVHIIYSNNRRDDECSASGRTRFFPCLTCNDLYIGIPCPGDRRQHLSDVSHRALRRRPAAADRSVVLTSRLCADVRGIRSERTSARSCTHLQATDKKQSELLSTEVTRALGDSRTQMRQRHF